MSDNLKLLNEICDAWESLRGGQHHSINDVQNWISKEMKPAMDKIRKEIGREIPK